MSQQPARPPRPRQNLHGCAEGARGRPQNYRPAVPRRPGHRSWWSQHKDRRRRPRRGCGVGAGLAQPLGSALRPSPHDCWYLAKQLLLRGRAAPAQAGSARVAGTSRDKTSGEATSVHSERRPSAESHRNISCVLQRPGRGIDDKTL